MGTISTSIPGSAIYAYCILDNNPNYTTFTSLTFTIDDAQVGSYQHTPDGSGTYVYNTLVYANALLSNGQHTFVIHNPITSDSLILFDYVVYSYVF
jgi:hypothetical protein